MCACVSVRLWDCGFVFTWCVCVRARACVRACAFAFVCLCVSLRECVRAQRDGTAQALCGTISISKSRPS